MIAVSVHLFPGKDWVKMARELIDLQKKFGCNLWVTNPSTADKIGIFIGPLDRNETEVLAKSLREVFS